MCPNKNRFYVQNGKVYPLTDDVPAEIIISDDDDVAVLGNKFPIGSIAHNLADGTTFVLDPTYTWVPKGSGSNGGNAVNGIFFMNRTENDGVHVLDKTFGEIKAAIEAGMYPVAVERDAANPSDFGHIMYLNCTDFTDYGDDDQVDYRFELTLRVGDSDTEYYHGLIEDDYPTASADDEA